MNSRTASLRSDAAVLAQDSSTSVPVDHLAKTVAASVPRGLRAGCHRLGRSEKIAVASVGGIEAIML